MDDKLKPNQEKRIIENCVESIMDDLDVYHFDEKLMNKYEKQLIEFFTKISEEHSLFSPGFDFSNKKNIVNDKEKIEEVLRIVNKSLEYGKAGEGPDKKTTIVWLQDDMKAIKKILADKS